MPTICMFFGIVIRMFADEHNPPHFHAQYQDYTATFDLEGEIINGEMPKRQCKFISAWAELHKDELFANWQLSINHEKPFKIEPLR